MISEKLALCLPRLSAHLREKCLLEMANNEARLGLAWFVENIQQRDIFLRLMGLMVQVEEVSRMSEIHLRFFQNDGDTSAIVDSVKDRLAETTQILSSDIAAVERFGAVAAARDCSAGAWMARWLWKNAPPRQT